MTSTALIVGSFSYFLLKFFGYSFFAVYLNYLFSIKHNIFKIGLVRTGLGISLGFAHNALFLSVLDVSMGRSPIGGPDTLLFFGLLVVLRIFEWFLILYWFYDRKLNHKKPIIFGISFGVIYSFILDVPVYIGLFTVVASIC